MFGFGGVEGLVGFVFELVLDVFGMCVFVVFEGDGFDLWYVVGLVCVVELLVGEG